MESFVHRLSRKLKQGYSVQLFSGNKYGVTNPHGEFLMEDGSAITFMDKEPGGRFEQNFISRLRRAGAIKDPPRRDPTVRPAVKVKHNAPKNSVIIATETLRDTSATPRERALARNYLELFETHTKVKRLAQALGRRLKDLEGQID